MGSDGDLLINPKSVLICPRCDTKVSVYYLSVLNLRAFAIKLSQEKRCSCGQTYQLSKSEFILKGWESG